MRGGGKSESIRFSSLQMNRFLATLLWMAVLTGPAASLASGFDLEHASTPAVETVSRAQPELPFLLKTPSLRAAGSQFVSEGGDSGNWALGGGSRFGQFGGEDFFAGLDLELPLGESTFLHARSMLERGGSGSLEEGFRQVVGYGIRFLDSETMRFDVVPGFVRTYGRFDPTQGAPVWTGNLSQNFVWLINDNVAIQQNVSSFVERFEDDSMAAVLNFDLETLLSDRLSFRVSYEVEYDDVLSDEFEKSNTRFSTSVGYRF